MGAPRARISPPSCKACDSPPRLSALRSVVRAVLDPETCRASDTDGEPGTLGL